MDYLNSVDTYYLVKLVHVLCAAGSISLFVIRGIWHLQNSPMLKHMWVRIVPHTIDAVLLASAGWLMVLTAQYPGTSLWLSVKLTAVLLYIGLGMVAFRFARDRRVKLIAWLAAVLVFALIVALAVWRV